MNRNTLAALAIAAMISLVAPASAQTNNCPNGPCSDPHDCYWGWGSALVHAYEESLLSDGGCTNVTSDTAPAQYLGECTHDWPGSRRTTLTCEMSGCYVTGIFVCPIPPALGGGNNTEAYALQCPSGPGGEIPRAVVDKMKATCTYANGLKKMAGCGSTGDVVYVDWMSD